MPFTTVNGGVPLASLRLNDNGIKELRETLGEGDMYAHFKKRFDAADRAWFMAAAHADGTHGLNANQFHPDWYTARDVPGATPQDKRARRAALHESIKTLAYDVVTMLDRVTGGCTLLLFSPCTVRPGEPLELERLKIEVCVNPNTIQERPAVVRPVAEIVQKFAEAFALPGARRWARAFSNAGFSLNDSADVIPTSLPHQPRPFMPSPQPGTSRYICWGRPVGEIEDMINAVLTSAVPAGDRDGPPRHFTQNSCNAPPASTTPPTHVFHDSRSTDSAAQIEDLQRQLNELQRELTESFGENQQLVEKLDLRDDQIDTIQRELAGAEREVATLQLQLSTKDAELSKSKRLLSAVESDLEETRRTAAVREQALGELESKHNTLEVELKRVRREIYLADDARFKAIQREHDLKAATSSAGRHVRSQTPAPSPKPSSELSSTPQAQPKASRPLAAPSVVPSSAAHAAGASPHLTSITTDMSSMSFSSVESSLSSYSPLPSHSPLPLRSPLPSQSPFPSRPPLPSHGVPLRPEEWQMPSLPLSGVHSEALTPFSIIGMQTHRVIIAHGLAPSLHRRLREIIGEFPRELWASAIADQLQIGDALAAELSRSMLQDL
ncbi:hypothetical protein PYCCODRAFT_1469126 [Trametes coccinea BRFM310]|uniref:Uncharacterized protein n=1 Tax=Trametes coccinea (strain BRFM310) TaxID=1353009 RepID=A0A1Y2IJ81_TRAC3|nr:hypothetical protein PYCCODRAFT_1469126 [Trametes coccinea BRFM310]